MATLGNIIDLAELYKRTFGGKPYLVPGASVVEEQNDFRILGSASNAEKEFTAKGSLIKEQYRGIEVMLPIRFYDGPEMLLHLPYCVISVGAKKAIIETPLAERFGSAKEQFNFDDYVFKIKGFLISEDRKFPEKEIAALNELNLARKAVTIDNALANIFLDFPGLLPDEQRRVVVYDFDLPETQGGRIHVKPFTMTIKSDTVFTLELK